MKVLDQAVAGLTAGDRRCRMIAMVGVLRGVAERAPRLSRPAADAFIADAITALVRALTADPGSAVHASIAGGRKTMGFYLGYALSLFGRYGWRNLNTYDEPTLPLPSNSRRRWRGGRGRSCR